jgi:hypothetical protein
MRKRLIAALIGAGAGALVLGAYYALLRAGIQVRPELLVGGGAALVFAGAVAVFSLVAMDRPAFRSGVTPLLLNEDPATQYVFFFKHPGALQITAKPDASVGEMLVRFGDAFKASSAEMTKTVVLTLKGGPKKPFATVTLQQLFGTLKPFSLEHVILTNDKDELIGYIPGKRAAVEFTGDKAVAQIDKYLVQVLVDPEKCAVLRELGGVTRDDTIGADDDSLHAQAKIWANEKANGLILHRHLKPVGFISKMDVLRLNARQ